MSSVPVTNININENNSPKKEEIKNSTNNQSVEIKESFSLGDNDNKTKKVIKVQEENINGNYGRIYIQESSSNRDGFKSNSNLNSDNNKSRPVQQKETKKTIITLNTNKNQTTNNKKKNYSISVDNKYEKKANEKPKNKNLRSKSIVRGGDYKNILITHYIYSSSDIPFHIIDPLKETTDEIRRKYMIKINDKNRNGRNGKVRVTYNCSCDKIKARPKGNLNLKGVITNITVPSRRKNNSIVKINEVNNEYKRNKERKEGKEGKDSIMKMKMRNNKSDNNANKGNVGGLSASYKKRNQKNNNNINNINIKKIN